MLGRAEYLPLEARGERARHVVAFARRDGAQWVIVVATRLFAWLGLRAGEAPVGAVWGDTAIELPAGDAALPAGTRLVDVMSGSDACGRRARPAARIVAARLPGGRARRRGRAMSRVAASDADVIERCRQASLQLLERNLTPQGILAASRTEAAEARRYTRIFGRDAAICALAMCGSGVDALERGAVASLDALAAQQAPNGQDAEVRRSGRAGRGLLVPRLHRRHAVVADRRRPRAPR